MSRFFYVVSLFYFFNFVFANNEEFVCENISYARAVEKAVHAVVSIQTVQEIQYTPHPSFDDPVFKFFFGEIPQDNYENKSNPLNKHFQQGLGSGVIVDKLGYILTNNHVIKDSNSISVKLYNGSSSAVELVGSDTRTDLAILKIKKKELLNNLPVISLGNSDILRVGDVVLAIGNPFGFDNTVTQGIVSGLGSVSARSNEQQVSFGGWLDNLIQTDAAINPGNSGGALIDVHGNLVGINLAIISRSGGSQGIGFAIPINLAKDIMEQLIKTGHIVRGWIGAQLQDISNELKSRLGYSEDYGVYVQGVIRNSPAQKAGILPGDIIVKINNIDVKSVSEAVKLVGSLQPNKNYSIEVFRKFKFYSFSVLISQVPKDQ
ncbi:Putative serine protease HhoB [Candidatus Azoamicus ciliaticola]|uniref:Serine protease HhoB n=1 Tax=Candidatus Azoamicus ciliaticola TaxID=2652803 RepID=A0A6J5JYK0_9GAMM|nr:Putative serine protease HhoB [Candidatus Azoamicus ciliaticola]